MDWKIIDSGVKSPEKNMKLDEELLNNLIDTPILHLYDWEGDAATYGYFANPETLLDMEGVKRRGLRLAKRPTGGGVIFHIWDLAFSVLLPANHPDFSKERLENYAYINKKVFRAVKEFLGDAVGILTDHTYAAKDKVAANFCMATPTKYDVMMEGKKIIGAAQRQKKCGLLHQGTISLMLPEEHYLKDVLLEGFATLEQMKAHTISLLPKGSTKSDLQEARVNMKRLLQKHIAL